MGMAENVSPATALRKTDTVGLLLKGFMLHDVTPFMVHILCPRLLLACGQYWDRQYCSCGDWNLARCQVPAKAPLPLLYYSPPQVVRREKI